MKLNIKSMKIQNSPSVFLLLLLFIASCGLLEKNEVKSDTSAYSFLENGLVPKIQLKGETQNLNNLIDRMEEMNCAGISIALIDSGKVIYTKGFGLAHPEGDRKVNTETLFQAASISKPLAGLGFLKLYDEGVVHIDSNVNTYLKEWKIKDTLFTQENPITLRKLLTHTAGMTVHGFPGYKPDDKFPSNTEVLDGKGNTPVIYVDTIPGSIWRYSGGGYTVAEQVMEDVTGMPFEDYMDENILMQIGMTNSTYQQPLNTESHPNFSAAFNRQGDMIEGEFHSYPEQAAAGLWTTPTDLARYILHIQNSLSGEVKSLLSNEALNEMLTKHENDWGLGPALRGEGDSLVFSHGGKNAGFTNNFLGFANKGQGIVVMTNCDNGNVIIQEILRAASAYFDWNLFSPEIVEYVELEEEVENLLTGDFVHEDGVDGNPEYLVKIYFEKGTLIVDDPNNGEKNYMKPINDSTYLDTLSGEKLVFSSEEIENTEFVWEGRFLFVKR